MIDDNDEWCIFTPQPSGLEGYYRANPGGRAASRLCETHISETAGRIFSVWSSMELSRPVVVQRHGHLPICPIWACPWAKNFTECISLKPLDGFTPFMDLSRPIVVQHHSNLPICPIWACPWAKNLSNQAALGPDFVEPMDLHRSKFYGIV